MPVRREDPMYMQVVEHYKQRILSGELATGQRMPSVLEIQREMEVSHGVAQRATQHLRTEGLIQTVPGEGAFVNGNRVTPSPQQRIRATTFPSGERIEIRAAEMIPAPEYVVPLLGLEPGADGVRRVIRREWITYGRENVPFMLSVSWHAPGALGAAPELLTRVPLPGPMVAAKLIAERTGRELTHGHSWREARPILDDGREGPLLRLPKGAAVLAETYTWSSGEDVLEYGEYILLMGQVVQTDMEP